MALKEPKTLSMEINNRTYSFPEGVSVHRAAELNNIYIPSLCSHKDLSPFGGCRLCMVEIEGMRGYPLSCNTQAQDGMKVQTDTEMLRELRKEILKLILCEHPSSCLFCEEKDNCKDYQGTIRKVGVTTGCRYCPNDGQCELQEVVDKIGISDLDYPIFYHGYEAEHDDPFYDRDYNICILCGRCVRMCQEVRGTGVLAFTYRGSKAKIGPAFGRSHIEAGCEFCGACVDVCPTGALADKVSKWDGKPDGFRISTCPFCAIGCQIELYYKDGRLSKAKANLDPEINDGQLCVRGRFCMPEVTHHFERARRPMLKKGNYFREVDWDEALKTVADKLEGIKPNEFLMLASPDLSNESLFAAQKFVRNVLGNNSIDSTARMSLLGGLDLWSWLFSLPISIEAISRADTILALRLDSRFDFSVIGVQVRRALNRGAKLVTIDSKDSNLARYTDHWLRPIPGTVDVLLNTIMKALNNQKFNSDEITRQTSVDTQSIMEAIQVLKSAEDLAVIIGPQVFHYSISPLLIEGLISLSKRKNTTFIPLYFGTNSRGALEMGVFPELLPGGNSAKVKGLTLVDLMENTVRPKVIYLVGEQPFPQRPDCDFLIAQDIYLPSFEVDAFLPASSFAETNGTLINLEGRVQEVAQIEQFPEGIVTGMMRPDWKIFTNLAELLKPGSMEYKDTQDILDELHRTLPEFPGYANRKPRRLPAKTFKLPKDLINQTPSKKGQFLLVAELAGYRHRGIDMSSKVSGLGELALEEGFRMNPDDMESLGVKNGDPITIAWDNGKTSVPGIVNASVDYPRGVVYFTKPIAYGGLNHREIMNPLYLLNQNPILVNVSVPKQSGGKAKTPTQSPKRRKIADGGKRV
jgi:formate dehydrogenase alpha subunit